MEICICGHERIIHRHPKNYWGMKRGLWGVNHMDSACFALVGEPRPHIDTEFFREQAARKNRKRLDSRLQPAYCGCARYLLPGQSRYLAGIEKALAKPLEIATPILGYLRGIPILCWDIPKPLKIKD